MTAIMTTLIPTADAPADDATPAAAVADVRIPVVDLPPAGAIPATAGAIPATVDEDARTRGVDLPAMRGATTCTHRPVRDRDDLRQATGRRADETASPTADGTNHGQRQEPMNRIFRSSVSKSAWHTTKANTGRDKTPLLRDKSLLPARNEKIMIPVIHGLQEKVDRSPAATETKRSKPRLNRRNRSWVESA
jgi:hypothetical protein